MFWEILWALILGFFLSATVQSLVSKGEMRRLLPDDSPRTLAVASGLGAPSSSCSYAAVALARSLFRKGADFSAAIAFQFASTNLVIESGIIMALILDWQFTVGEFVGGPLMIVLVALLSACSCAATTSSRRASFKTELIADRAWPTRTSLKLAIVEWVTWFNTDRLHESLGDLPPAEFETLRPAGTVQLSLS